MNETSAARVFQSEGAAGAVGGLWRLPAAVHRPAQPVSDGGGEGRPQVHRPPRHQRQLRLQHGESERHRDQPLQAPHTPVTQVPAWPRRRRQGIPRRLSEEPQGRLADR